MSDTSNILEINNICKRFSKNFKRSLFYGMKDIAKEIVGISKEETALRESEFWALDQVSFNLKRGESLGLLGLNGSGKTTLLKMINGLLKPTAGTIKVKGTIGALIALGTGFNPVLSGRENVRINASVLGFSKKEINEKFDEILEFSGIGDFIDSPVQTYSSGMQARLGFSVAVHTSPDLLLVDEVLAVGDLTFALKCLKKISDFKNKGGSLIMVSHDIFSLRLHCDRAVWLNYGKLMKYGEVNEVCNEYEVSIGRGSDIGGSQQRFLSGDAEIIDVKYPEKTNAFEPFEIEFTVKCTRPISKPLITFSIQSVNVVNLLSNLSNNDGYELELKEGINRIRLSYDYLLLNDGIYYLSLVVSEELYANQLVAFVNCWKLEIKNSLSGFNPGFFRLTPKWDWKPID